MQVLEGILELKVANEVAEFAGQFFDLIEPDSGDVVATSCLIDDTESEVLPPRDSQLLPSGLSTDVGSGTMFFGDSFSGAPDESE